jgi:RNA 3'-terminal phosphate cyclase (ATP)
MGHPVLDIDGSFGEGGGQILRTSLALSLVTGKGFHLRNIRAGRAQPGLKAQHLMSVRAAATVGQATVRGASLGSTDLVFEPGEVIGGKYTFAIGTAGAISLVLHTLYLPLCLRASTPSEIVITGGTHVSHSPSFHFLDRTWRGYVQLLGMRITLQMRRPGFYPRGGGALEAHLQPCDKLRRLHLSGGPPITTAAGFSAVAGLPADIARRQARRANFRLKEAGIRCDIVEETWSGGPGSVLAIELPTTPVPTLYCGLGQRGKPAERVADEAVDEALAHFRTAPAAVDAHSADQLVLPLALAEEASSFAVAEVTQHLLTNLAVIRRFVERDMMCEGEEGKPGHVRIGT